MDKPQNKYIAVAYKLYTAENGESNLVEEATEERPFQFISGFGVTLDAFEKEIAGLEQGAEFDFELTKDEAYGDNQKHRPVMIHRAPFGSMERFVAVLIEHTAGKFPLWLTPEQVCIMPISEKFNDYAWQIARELGNQEIRAIVDDRNEKIGRKIRDNELKRIPYMLIVGEKEAENSEVSVRKQGEGDKGSMKIATFAALLNGEVEEMMNRWQKSND